MKVKRITRDEEGLLDEVVVKGPIDTSREPWNGLLWGIRSGATSGVLGRGWTESKPHHDGEPYRALLFNTRREARDWCRAKREQRASNCEHWRFTPVRVRETVVEVGR